MSWHEDEDYFPWYRRETATWRELSMAARGVLVSVQMHLNRKTGGMPLRKGLESLAVILGRPWSEIHEGLGECIASGKLEWDGSSFVLFDPDLGERVRPTSADRTRAWRERKKSSAPPVGDKCDVTTVTSVREHAVTPVTQREEKRREEKRLKNQISVPAKAVTGVPDQVWEHYVATVKLHRPRRRPGALTPKDRKRIDELLGEGFTADDLKRAVSGLFRSLHHLGQNDRNTEYLELTYALRKPATYIQLEDEATPPVSTAPPAEPEEYVDPALIAAAEEALSKRAS